MRRPGTRSLLVALGLYVGAALALFRRAASEGFFDTIDLRAVARQPLASAAFWRGARPPGYPLVLKALGPESPWVLRLQLALHLGAWALVAWGIARRCRTAGLRVACFAAILAASLSPGLFDWSHVYLTESLSLSLLALPLGLVLVMVPGPPRPLWLRLAVVAVACLSLLEWVLLRDLDSAWLPIAAIAAAALAYARRAAPAVRRATVVATIVALALAALTSRSIQVGQRWRYPMVNVIGRRVLPLPDRKARWQRAGMPDNAKVRCFTGLWATDCRRDFSGFEPWLTRAARRTYARDLLLHPRWLLLDPLLHWKELLCGNHRELGDGPLRAYFFVEPMGWQRALGFVFLANWVCLAGELLSTLALVALARRRAGLRLDATTAPFVVLALTVYPAMMLAWHGDAMEMQRHALVAMASLRIAMWGALAVSIDRLWQARARASAAA